jgi:hypothetical protein
MLRVGARLVILSTFSACAMAQPPSSPTLGLSLKTMSKALAGCRESYTRVYPGASAPLSESLVGVENYKTDLKSLTASEKLANFLIAHPEQVTGKILVMILSTADDFTLGVGSTRTEIFRHVALDVNDPKRESELLVASESLNDCQKSLMNAGDDFVEIVANYIGAEDSALAAKAKVD